MVARNWTIGIHPDDYTDRATPDKYNASSPRWAELLQAAGHKVKWVDVRRADIFEQLEGCQGFMWRWVHFGGMGRIARRLLPVIERELGLVVYPDQNTCWHYDDKIAQTYLLKATGIPIPQTWVWFDPGAAKEWTPSAPYPLVLKLATGAGSTNVQMIHNATEANLWIDRLFKWRLTSLDKRQFGLPNWRQYIKALAQLALRGKPVHFFDNGYEPQSGYVLFQEFLPNNSFDTRVTVIGNRAFAFRRFNRDNDFRASGSGRIDWATEQIDLNFVRLAFRTAQMIKSQSCAIDGLYTNKGSCVTGEISYTYASWAVHKCPGHWKLNGDPNTGELNWFEGNLWPEEAQVEDFLTKLENNQVLKE